MGLLDGGGIGRDGASIGKAGVDDPPAVIVFQPVKEEERGRRGRHRDL